MFCQRIDSYLTLPSDFGVYHCECQSDLLLVTRYSSGAEHSCFGKYNTGFITIFLRCIIAKNYPNRPRIDKVIGKIKRVQFFLKHSVEYCSSLSESVPESDGHREPNGPLGEKMYNISPVVNFVGFNEKTGMFHYLRLTTVTMFQLRQKTEHSRLKTVYQDKQSFQKSRTPDK